jgi:hypothetical protein
MGIAQVVNIDISGDGGTTWQPLTTFTTTSADSGTYSWVVTGPPTTHARVRVRWAADLTVTDISGEFTIRP